MKKFLMIAALAVAGLAQADDSYLYWMVPDNIKIDWDYAKVKVAGTDQYLTLYNGYDTTSEGSLGKTAGSEFAEVSVAAQLGQYASSSYSFLIELYNENNGKEGYSDTLGYSALANYIGSEMSPTANSWDGTNWHIPEPSSGLLALLGMSLLALRRRRMKA